MIIAGDFNKLPIHRLTRQFQFKQIVNFPARGSNKLDLTNLAEYYENPTRTPPLGFSDHVTVLVPPKIRVKEEQSTQVKYLRDKRPNSIGRLGRFFGEIHWDFVINPDFTCEQNLTNFTDIVNYGLNCLAPLKAVKVRMNDRPWMNSNLKRLIQKYCIGNYEIKSIE